MAASVTPGDPDRGIASFEDIPTATVPSAPDPARLLSDYKDLEMLRIGLRDVRGEQSVRENGEDLSRLAEIIVRLACERARQELRTAGADLVVMALGKFGGRELLYGSDLDLVFFCRSERERVGASAMARRIAGLLAQPGAPGKPSEVDPRLGPGGSGGELVATPSGFRDYFERGTGRPTPRTPSTAKASSAGAACRRTRSASSGASATPRSGPAGTRPCRCSPSGPRATRADGTHSASCSAGARAGNRPATPGDAAIDGHHRRRPGRLPGGGRLHGRRQGTALSSHPR